MCIQWQQPHVHRQEWHIQIGHPYPAWRWSREHPETERSTHRWLCLTNIILTKKGPKAEFLSNGRMHQWSRDVHRKAYWVNDVCRCHNWFGIWHLKKRRAFYKTPPFPPTRMILSYDTNSCMVTLFRAFWAVQCPYQQILKDSNYTFKGSLPCRKVTICSSFNLPPGGVFSLNFFIFKNF